MEELVATIATAGAVIGIIIKYLRKAMKKLKLFYEFLDEAEDVFVGVKQILDEEQFPSRTELEILRKEYTEAVSVLYEFRRDP